MHTVADLLAKKPRDVVWIGPLESVFEALTLMNEKDVGALCVQIEDYLVGIISERDYVRKVILDIHASKLTKVSEVMTNDVITVKPEDTVLHCIALTKKHHIRHLPVVKEGKAIGMVSLRDLFLDAIEEQVGEVDEDE